jgi:hypothetical protein
MHNGHAMKPLRGIALTAILGVFFKPFWALAVTESAHSAPQFIVTPLQAQAQAQSNPAVKPLKNLQIEIRQIGSETAQRSSMDAPGRSTQSRSLQQQALVLNGRSVSFKLGQTVPLRVVQVLNYKEVLNFVPTTVLIDRNSGFTARPLWYGDEVAEVEISTTLTQGARQSKLSTTLPVQINEWITIAQSEDAQASNSNGILSRSSERGQSSLRVEMRVTVR